MHTSSYKRMKHLLDWYNPYWDNKQEKIEILDIGSYDQNGVHRKLFNDVRYIYMGLDLVDGPNVDIVPKDTYKWDEIEDDKYDLVISGQVFEHIEYPWLTIKEIARILRPGGFVIIIAPNAGFEHKAPFDCYRYYSDGLRALAKWADLFIHHASVAGVPRIDVDDNWVSKWNDSVLVAQKLPIMNHNIANPFRYEKRMSEDGSSILSYLNENVAVEDIIQKYNDKKFILFGAGIWGEKILTLLGNDRVYCFCDNDTGKIGSIFHGKQVCSLETIKSIHDAYYVIVTVNSSIATKIHEQLNAEMIKTIDIYKV